MHCAPKEATQVHPSCTSQPIFMLKVLLPQSSSCAAAVKANMQCFITIAVVGVDLLGSLLIYRHSIRYEM